MSMVSQVVEGRNAMTHIQTRKVGAARAVRNGLVVLMLLGTAGVGFGHSGHSPKRAAKPTTEELAAFETAKPVFERFCFRCHTKTGKKTKRKALDHLSMDRYPFGGHHAGEAAAVIRTVLGVDGKSATMPSDDPGAVTGEDLDRVLSWAAAFERTQAAKSSVPPTTKETTHAH